MLLQCQTCMYRYRSTIGSSCCTATQHRYNVTLPVGGMFDYMFSASLCVCCNAVCSRLVIMLLQSRTACYTHELSPHVLCDGHSLAAYLRQASCWRTHHVAAVCRDTSTNYWLCTFSAGLGTNHCNLAQSSVFDYLRFRTGP